LILINKKIVLKVAFALTNNQTFKKQLFMNNVCCNEGRDVLPIVQ